MRYALLAAAMVLSVGCAGARRRADLPSDLRDAPAALPHATAAAMPVPGAPAMPAAAIGGAHRARQDFATELAQWHQSMQRAIDSTGGFARMPENLRLRLGLRLSEVEALYERDARGRLRPRTSRFAARSQREILEWIQPVQRFYHNAIERNPAVPAELRQGPARIYQELQRAVYGR